MAKKGLRYEGAAMGSTVAAMAFGAFAMGGTPAEASLSPQERSGVVLVYEIPAGSVATALNAFAVRNGLHLLYEAHVTRALRTPGLSGAFSLREGLDRLLVGTGLTYRFGGPDEKAVSIILAQNDTVRSDAGGAEPLPPIDVGAERPVAAPGRAGGAGKGDPTAYHVPDAVTATKTNTPIMETPISIQVVPQQVLQDQQATTLARAVDNVSGVRSFTATYVGGNDQFQVRGFNSTVTYLDGLRTTQGNPGTNTLSNIERVEVLKGPASILYGRAEPGGIVNIVTKKPLAAPQYSVDQMFGSWNTYRTVVDATGPLTKDGSVLYRLTGEVDHHHSFQNFYAARNYVVSPVVQWNIDAATQITTHFQYGHQNEPFDIGAITYTKYNPLSLVYGVGPVGFIPRGRTFEDPNSNSKLDTMRFGFNWSHKFNEYWTLTNRFQAVHGEGRSYLTATSGFNATNPLLLNRAYVANNGRTYTYATNLDLTGNFDTFGVGHTLLLGGDYFLFRGVNSLFGFSNFPVPSINYLAPTYAFTPNEDYLYKAAGPGLISVNRQNWLGVYLQDQIKLPYDLFLLVGARYDNVVVRSNGFAGKGDLTTDNSERVTPRFGLLWRPIRELSLYASYVENFGAAGGLAGPAGAQQILPPQTAEQWEVGVKTELFDQRLTATIAYFNLIKQHVATPDPDPTRAALGFQVSAGEIRNKGFELDVAGEVLPGWKVIAGYSYIDSLVTKDNGVVTDPLGNIVSYNGVSGFIPAGVSRHMGNLWTTYEFQSGDWKGLKFGGGANTRSKAYGDRLDSYHTPGYATVGLMAAYSWMFDKSKLTAQLNVENLLDTRYYPEGTRSAVQVDVGAPRTFRGSLRMEF
ncbi:MAG TPA: TonB-dependent receptor [Methylosinus sp.]|uniref:TonB-dependent siderophore receptor n=1 Tax=Methylosinus sp. TaxID=427 RepID=UPI002F94F0EA